MYVIWLILSFCFAIGLEAYAWNILIFSANEHMFINIFLWHTLASVIAALGSLLIRIGYDDHYTARFMLFFVMIMMMPGLGLLGMSMSVLHALYYPKKKDGMTWNKVVVPDLPHMPVEVEAHSTYGAGGLASVILFAGDVDRRVSAVIAIKNINDRVGIPLLLEALKDPEDDVRLFAYSVLDSKTNKIGDRISRLQETVELEEDQGKIRSSYYALAQSYWELAFLGLATGNTLDFVLQQTEHYGIKARDMGWSGPDVEFLLGRVYLHQKKYEQAKEYFHLSLKHGALESAILPFLSEIAYEIRDFQDVCHILHRLDESCDGHPPIPAVVQSWA